jgi:hypothetical protein
MYGIINLKEKQGDKSQKTHKKDRGKEKAARCSRLPGKI